MITISQESQHQMIQLLLGKIDYNFVTLFLSHIICYRSSIGSILIFSYNKSNFGSKTERGEISLTMSESLATSSMPISCLSSSAQYLFSGNDNGDIFGFSISSSVYEMCCRFSGNGYPCNSICHSSDGVVFCGFHTGHVRIYRSSINELSIEITAHIRPITGLIYNKELELLVSCSEDQYIHVWNAPDFSSPQSSKIELLHSDRYSDRMCTGIGFLYDERICVASFDDDNLIILKKDIE